VESLSQQLSWQQPHAFKHATHCAAADSVEFLVPCHTMTWYGVCAVSYGVNYIAPGHRSREEALANSVKFEQLWATNQILQC